MSVIGDLNDNCFSLATQLLVELCAEVENEAGKKPTLADICELLTWALRSCSADILEDVNPSNILALEARVMKHGKIKLQPGDVVAIPARSGNYHLAAFITKNQFGHAFGILEGEHKLRPFGSEWQPKPARHPIYTGDRFVANGRWHVVGNYPHLLELFPKGPEIYHEKTALPEDAQIGPYGSAESPEGRLRHITKEEAKEVGLLDGRYRQSLLGELLERFLEERTRTAANQKKTDRVRRRKMEK